MNAATVGAGGLTFDSASTDGAANGILLDTIGSGPVSINGGSIANATTTANPVRTTGTISNNTVGTSPNASGIVVIGEGNAQTGSVIGTVAITDNTISGIGNGGGIRVQAGVGATLNMTISGNTPDINDALNLEGIHVESGSSTAGDNVNSVCLNLLNNKSTVGAASGQEDYCVTARGTNVFVLQDFVGSCTSATDVTNWVTATKNNKKADGVSTPTVQVSLVSGGAFSASAGNCTTP